jgi:DNA-directed RNA polymerase specialized sigma24 family protein
MPESLRAPFWLRWHEELSFAQIAEQLDSSEVAMRKRYSRALAELRRLLAGWLPAEVDRPGGAR